MHAPDRELAVAQAHDLALGGFGGNFEAGRQGDALDQQRVVPGGLKRLWETGEDVSTAVLDRGHLTVHEAAGAHDLATKIMAQGLVTEANA